MCVEHGIGIKSIDCGHLCFIIMFQAYPRISFPFIFHDEFNLHFFVPWSACTPSRSLRLSALGMRPPL